MPALLVSVRDAAEAAAALEGGADLIDVKDPSAGSLGRADELTIRAVREAVAGRVPVSAALGELRDECRPTDLTGLAFVKFGLSGMATADWRMRLRQRREHVERTPCRLVVTAYADWHRADAPSPTEVFRFAAGERAGVVLLDTWGKDGSTLLEWLSVTEVAGLCEVARMAGVRVALAGSLRREQIERLRELRPDWFAVRGAACAAGERTGGIDARRVRELAELVRG